MDVRGARSHGQEVLEPSVDLDATSTALPVDSRWSMLLGQPKRARQPRGHPTPGPAPHLEGPWALPSLKSEFSDGFADLAPAVCMEMQQLLHQRGSPLLPSPGTLPSSATWQARFTAQ